MADTAIPYQVRRDSFRELKRTIRGVTRAIKSVVWSMTHKPITDEERLAFNLAVMHIRNGRTDLAVEDLSWLGNRLEASS